MARPLAVPQSIAAVLAMAVVLAACQSNPYQWDAQTARNVDAAMSEAARAAAGKPAVPPEVSEALLPSLDGRPDGAVRVTEPRFDLSVSNAPARQVFMGLVEGTPYSMVVHPEVSGSVTLHLKNATVPEAMDTLRAVYGYEYRRDGNRFMVLGRGMQTRLIPVNYLNLERMGRSDTRVTSGDLSQAGNTGASAVPGMASSAGQQRNRPIGVQVETESKIEFWKSLRETVAMIIGCEAREAPAEPALGRDGRSLAGGSRVEFGCKGGRMVAVNPQANLVVVRAMPDELRLVDDYLGITQDTVNRQVILEAKIIEVELKDGYQTGINWAALGGNSVFGQVGGGTAINQGNTLLSGLTPTGTPPGNYTGILDPNTFSAITGTATSAFGGVFSAAVKTADFAAFIELLKTQGDVHVLSSPRVSTVNNQKALIKVGADSIFATDFQTSSAQSVTTGATVSTALIPKLQSFFSGITLDVTPQIDEVGNILLHIHPAVTVVTEENKQFRDLLEKDSNTVLPLATSAVQESDSIVRAASGQIIVIGGLMKEGTTDQNASIPFLGDIPILGNAFKHKRVSRIKRELVIMLKPTIVESPRQWEAAIQDSQERMQRYKR